MFPSEAIGITSTIPIEVPLSAGRQVVDLNNLFILSPHPLDLIKTAESDGFPRNCCAWIKGIYGLVKTQNIKRLIFVTGGDCSNTHALMETLLPGLQEVFTFAYPYPEHEGLLKGEMERFCNVFSTNLQRTEMQGNALVAIRKDLAELDRLTWEEGKISGEENHLWLVSGSDFQGDPSTFHSQLKAFLEKARVRPSRKNRLRLGVVGVPSIHGNLHAVVEELGGSVLFNEIPRQFAMIGEAPTLIRRYTAFTYPYGVWPRAKDIKEQATLRKLDGIIHYTQSFCHRQIHDIVIRQEIGLPTLTLEGENPGPVDQRTKLRIESFLEILLEKKRKGN